jgi:thioredoxin 1
MRNKTLVLALSTLTLSSAAIARPQSDGATFVPLETWRAAILSGNAAALEKIYSRSPEAKISNAKGAQISFPDEMAFWSAWKSKGLSDAKLEIIKQQDTQEHVHVLAVQIALTLKDGATQKKQYVTVSQGWMQQAGQWLVASEKRTEPVRLKPPTANKDIYPVGVNAQKEIDDAIRKAGPARKRVLVVFGGNWCYDCHVLDEAFHSPEIAPTLNKSFDVVHVDIGEMNKNLDVAKKYDIPLDRGVPAIAVVESDGTLLFSQKRGEFEAARSMAPEDILNFLNQWKPVS